MKHLAQLRAPDLCSDLESFVRGSPNLMGFFLFLFFRRERGFKPNKYHFKRAIIDPPAKRHLMAFRWRADVGPTLNAGLVAL